MRILLTALFCLSTGATLHAQTLTLKTDCDSTAKPYSSVLCIDARTHFLLGVVQKSVANVPRAVRYDGDLAQGLTRFFAADAPTGGASPDAVLILQDFFLTERSGFSDETGYFKLNLRLFGRTADDRYTEVFSADTTYRTKGFDVTGRLMRSVSEHLCSLAEIARERGFPVRTDTGRTYTLAEVQRVDSFEKMLLPAYAMPRLPTGLYRTYADFKEGRPAEGVPLSAKAFRK